MKALGKLMRNWAIALSFVFTSIIFGWSPVTDLIHDMGARQAGVWAIIGALFIACVLMCWSEHKKRRASNAALLKSQETPETSSKRLCLWYLGENNDGLLQMPVDNVWHAQDLLSVLGITNAAVSDSPTGKLLYMTDAHGTLVKV